MQLPSRRTSTPHTPPSLTLVEPRAAEDTMARWYAAVLLGSLLAGFLVRAGFVFAADFPLNDGGMFYQMVRDLQANDYALPAETTYNSAGIPFAYPPLAMYIAAFIDDVTTLPLVDVFRFMPLLFATLSMGAFHLLARALFKDRLVVVASTALFAFLPPTFLWMIMGGGLTRSLGYFLAIVTMHQALRMFQERTWWRVVPVAALAVLTVLSHLEMALFAAIGCGTFLFVFARDRHGVALSAGVSVLTFALTAPWWGAILAIHGFDPFIAALRSGRESELLPLFNIVQFEPTAEPMFTVIAALAALGIAASLARRTYWLPLWLLAVFLIDPRAFPSSGSVAIALLGGVAVARVLAPMLATPSAERDGDPAKPAPWNAPPWLAPAVCTVGGLYLFFSAMVASPMILTAQTPAEREAMAWAGTNTPDRARFAIVTDDAWPLDRTSEWFPVLAGRESVATVQGTEWLPNGAFHEEFDEYIQLQKCANAGVNCLDAWIASTGETFHYLYIPKLSPRTGLSVEDECCAGLVNALDSDARYHLVFENEGALIFKRADASGRLR